MADGAEGSDEELDEAPESAPSPLRGFVSAVLDVLRTRLDLVTVEAEIYLLRTMQTLLWALAALACALLGFVFVIVAIIAALWDTHRMAGVLGAAGLFVLLATIFGYVAARTFRFRPMVLDKTLQQLEHDRDRVNGGAG